MYNKDDVQMACAALEQQITRATRYWIADVGPKHQPTLAAYRRGLKRVSKQALDEAMANMGLERHTPARFKVPGTELVAYRAEAPGRLLIQAPDDDAVDVIVQIGLFGGVVFS
jgi:hypothetical protein